MQYSDVDVSRKKFGDEVSTFLRAQSDWRERGVFLVYNEFPKLEFVFSCPQLKPPSIAFAVLLDFTNYDIEPPSVVFIDPFTRNSLLRKDIAVNFFQLNLPKDNPMLVPGMMIQPQDLLQGLPDDVPFFCIRGVREYHNHPTHTGDSWFLYRTRGEGRLSYLLDQLYNYSIAQISKHKVTLQPVLNFEYNIVLRQNE